MFDHCDPWLSDVDIQAGDRSMEEIRSKLDDCGFGIIVVTSENMEKPWLNFEAGALSKSFGDAKSRVVPLLVNINEMYQLKGPINQFQAVMLNKVGMAKLCDTIALTIGLELGPTRARFEWAWPDLDAGIERAKEIAGDQPELPDVNEKELLRDLYSMVRSLQEQQLRQDDRPLKTLSGRASLIPDEKKGTMRIADILAHVHQIASEYKPVENVGFRTNDRGQGEIVISFADGVGLPKALHAKLQREVARVTPYDVVIK